LSIKKHFLWMLVSKAFLMGSLLITAGLINRALGPSSRGILAEMQTWVGLFSVIFGISMDTAIYHFANRNLYESEDKQKFSTSFILSLALSFIAAISIAVFVNIWPEEASSKTAEHLILLSILLFFTMLSANVTVFFQALGYMGYSAYAGLLQAVVSVIIIGYGYFTSCANLPYVIISLVLIQVVALLSFLKLVISFFSLKDFSKELAGGIIVAGLKQHVATISTFVYVKVNQITVLKYCGELEAGIFAVALNLAIGLMVIPGAMQLVLYPRVIHSLDDYDVTIKALRLTFYGWGSIVLLILLFAKPILLVYGGVDFLPSVTSFRIILVGTWMLTLSSIVAPYFVKAGVFVACSATAAILGVISIGLNMLLVDKYHAVGASIATLITTTLGFCMVMYLFGYVSKKNPFRFLLIHK